MFSTRNNNRRSKSQGVEDEPEEELLFFSQVPKKEEPSVFNRVSSFFGFGKDEKKENKGATTNRRSNSQGQKRSPARPMPPSPPRQRERRDAEPPEPVILKQMRQLELPQNTNRMGINRQRASTMLTPANARQPPQTPSSRMSVSLKSQKRLPKNFHEKVMELEANIDIG